MIALQKEIRVQECSSESAYVPPPSISTTAAFSVSTKFTRGIASKKKGLVCAFCKGPHPTHTCESVTDLQKWLEVVKKDNLCYNVWLITRCHSASQDSGVRSARSTIPPCVTVKLNPKDPLKDSKPPEPSSTDVSQHLTPVSPCTTPLSATHCLLKTAIAPIIAGNRPTLISSLMKELNIHSYLQPWLRS